MSSRSHQELLLGQLELEGGSVRQYDLFRLIEVKFLRRSVDLAEARQPNRHEAASATTVCWAFCRVIGAAGAFFQPRLRDLHYSAFALARIP